MALSPGPAKSLDGHSRNTAPFPLYDFSWAISRRVVFFINVVTTALMGLEPISTTWTPYIVLTEAMRISPLLVALELGDLGLHTLLLLCLGHLPLLVLE